MYASGTRNQCMLPDRMCKTSPFRWNSSAGPTVKEFSETGASSDCDTEFWSPSAE